MKKVNRKNMRAIQKKALKEVKQQNQKKNNTKLVRAKVLSTDNKMILYLDKSLERIVHSEDKKKK